LPSTAEEEDEDEDDGEDMYEKAPPSSPPPPPPVILVNEPVQELQSDLMADIDKGIGECDSKAMIYLFISLTFFSFILEHRVRSLYAFEGDGPEDLCELSLYIYLRKWADGILFFSPAFGENLIIIANPSKSDGDWWYGKTLSTGKSGLFPKTYVEIVTPSTPPSFFSLSLIMHVAFFSTHPVYSFRESKGCI